MEVITYKCPNCGGDLTFDPASGKYKCEYCLSSFTQEEAEKANPKAAEALNVEDDAAGAHTSFIPTTAPHIFFHGYVQSALAGSTTASAGGSISVFSPAFSSNGTP